MLTYIHTCKYIYTYVLSTQYHINEIHTKLINTLGQYIFICCPEISVFEWHPFTLTSSPYEDFISIHIRVVGDWTTKFSSRLGCQFGEKVEETLSKPISFPYIMIDGGFASASEYVFDYEAVILIGAGIGVTPFASILKTIWYRYTENDNLKKLKKVYFIWICREKDVSLLDLSMDSLINSRLLNGFKIY